MHPLLRRLLLGLWQRVFWTALIVILLIASMSSTQTTRSPIFFAYEGDLFSIRPGDAEPFRETYWGYNQAPVLSPDGQYIAYGSFPELLIELDASGEFPINYDQHPPTNIWVMEIATRNFKRIADQPAQTGDEPHLIRRTTPVWSPDSSKLAWLELDLQGAPNRGLYLVVADLETGTQIEGPGNLPGVNGDAGMFGITDGLTWGKTLAFDAFTYGLPDLDMVGMAMTVLDTDTIFAQWPIVNYNVVPDSHVQQWHWVEYDGDLYLAFEYLHGWQLWDYQTDRYFAISGPPTLQSASGEEGLRLSYDPQERTWTVIEVNGTHSNLPEGVFNLALSPDGQQIVYQRLVTSDDGTTYELVVWQDGDAQAVFTPPPDRFLGGMVWGPTVWRVEEPPVPLPHPTVVPTSTPGMG